MSYKVIRPFRDLSDPEQHDYALGDTFPRANHEPSEDFTKGLMTGTNSAGSIFIIPVDGDVSDEDTGKEATEKVTKTTTRKRSTKKVEG